MATDQIWKTRRLTQELDSDMNSSGLVDQGPGILGYLRGAVILRTQKLVPPRCPLLRDVPGLPWWRCQPHHFVTWSCLPSP